MKNLFSTTIIVCALIAGTATASYAQKKANETKMSAYSGPIIKKKDPSEGANLSNLFNMKMHQSISASVGSFGGTMMNTFAITNSMRFFFTPKLTGQLNVSLLTSPFSQLNFYGFQNSHKLQVALDARLKYQINKNLDVQLNIRRSPRRYGLYGIYPGSFYGRFYGSPYYYSPGFEY